MSSLSQGAGNLGNLPPGFSCGVAFPTLADMAGRIRAGENREMQFRLMNLIVATTVACFVAATVTTDVARFALWLPLAMLFWHVYHFGRELRQWP